MIYTICTASPLYRWRNGQMHVKKKGRGRQVRPLLESRRVNIVISYGGRQCAQRAASKRADEAAHRCPRAALVKTEGARRSTCPAQDSLSSVIKNRRSFIYLALPRVVDTPRRFLHRPGGRDVDGRRLRLASIGIIMSAACKGVEWLRRGSQSGAVQRRRLRWQKGLRITARLHHIVPSEINAFGS